MVSDLRTVFIPELGETGRSRDGGHKRKTEPYKSWQESLNPRIIYILLLGESILDCCVIGEGVKRFTLKLSFLGCEM